MSPSDYLRHYWGYDSFRECQLEIINSVLANHDTIGLLPTGGGKSICFQIPALMLPGITLVVTPLISLMKDQVDNLRDRGIRAGCLNSGMTRPEQTLVRDRLRLGKIKLLYVSPEKLARKDFIADLRQWDISLIVVDEAHCISQWGYDFRPSYLGLASLRKEFPGATWLALTASAPPEVVKDISDKLGMRSPAIFARSFSRPNISYIVRHPQEKDGEMLRILTNTSGSAIVYARSRRRTVELASLLSANGISADFYHAGLDTHTKVERQDNWKTGQTRVMVATNAFGMGIDKPDVRVVVHYDLPPTLEEYYQEAGRAGRDGLPSFAVTLASTPDKALLTRRFNDSFPGREYILHVYERVGNFLEIGIGEGYDRVCEFNLPAFLKVFDLKPAPTLAALHTLTRAGVFVFDENTSSRSRVAFLVDKRDLYDLRLDPVTDSVLQWMLRTYAGLFADYIPIDENIVGIKAHCSANDVYNSLLLLSRMKVLSYIPKSNIPFIYWSTSREEPRHIQIPRLAYEDLMEKARKRMECLRDYMFDDSTCRVERMLSYFGDSSAAPCGKCDVCRGNAEATGDGALAVWLDNLLKATPEGIDIMQLKESLPAKSLSTVLELIRAKAEEGKVEICGTRIKALS